MQKEILELEQILEQEIDACSKLEKYIADKKNYLIKGDIEGIMNADIELEKYNSAIEKLEEKRLQLFPDRPNLKEIIDTIEEKKKAQEMTNLRNKLTDLLTNTQKQNNVNAELIKHSLKIIEGSISSIVKVLVPENPSYNNKGSFIKDNNTETISSVIHEA